MTAQDPDVLAFWNQRAVKGARAGTDDFILTEIERAFLRDVVPSESRVIDLGCGNAGGLIDLVHHRNVTGVGLDFAPALVAAARQAVWEANLESRLNILEDCLPDLTGAYDRFDTVISQRCLINLNTAEAQTRAFRAAADLVAPGGRLVLVEATTDGLAATNDMRRILDLPAIDAPWHNRFLSIAQVAEWATPDLPLVRVVHVSSTYYFVSRVLYARLATNRGEDMVYDSELNRIAQLLPQEIGNFGSVKAFVFERPA